MRERNTLAARIDSVRAIENAMNDNIGLIEMGEAEGDAGIVQEA